MGSLLVKTLKKTLGALLIDKESIIDVADILKPEMFFFIQHRLIYATILKIYLKSHSISPQILVEELRKEGNFEKAGGMPMITDLADSTFSADHIKDHEKFWWNMLCGVTLSILGAR